MNKKPYKAKDHLAEKLKDPHFRESYAVELFKAQISKIVIGERIKQKITQGELAEKIGVSQQVISKIENGDFSCIKTVMHVLLALQHRATITLPPQEAPL